MADDVKPLETKTPKDVIHAAKERGAKIVDLRFIDLPGLWQHFSIPAHELDEELFAEGIGFDGSSIRGFQTIDESDMLLMPDPTTAQMDPFTAVPTLVLICNVKDPVTMEAYTRDPRYVAQKAELYLKQTGMADTVYIGPELEFFIFDSIRFDQGYNFGYYYIDSEAAPGTRGRKAEPGLPARATSRATSRSRRWTTSRTSGPTWCWPSRRSASGSRCTTTRWRPAARPRSTCGTTR